jgi:hypothetical protein
MEMRETEVMDHDLDSHGIDDIKELREISQAPTLQDSTNQLIALITLFIETSS